MGLFDGIAGMLGGAGGQSGGAGAMIGEMLNRGQPGASSGVLGSLLGSFGAGGAGAAAADPAAAQADGAAAPGGMAGMLEQLAAGGLAQHVESWLSNNPNLPVSPQQIHDALGSEQVQAMARSSGLPVGDFLSQLATHLPQAAAEQAGTAPA